jgi:hypothetical protein
MYTVCPKCNDRFNDEHVSTACPHRGIGYCRACDGTICVCLPETKDIRSRRFSEVRSVDQSTRVEFAVDYMKGTMYGAALAAFGFLLGALWLRVEWLLWSCLVCESVSGLAWVLKRELEKPEDRA